MSSRPRRSKRGCDTCRFSKVKCDEGRPKCARCGRLSLMCTWSSEALPLNIRRRGYGTLRNRDESWAPKPILPSSAAPGSVSIGQSFYGLQSETFTEQDSSIVAEIDSEDWWTVFNAVGDSSQWLLSSDDLFSQQSDLMHPGMGYDNMDELPATNGVSLPVASPSEPTAILGHSLSHYHMELPNSLTLSTYEHQALRHYQTTFSLYRTTKDPNWSTHKVLLNLGSQNEMIMHLLLAVSINDHCLRKGEDASYAAQIHFRTGALMLIDMMGNGAESDHVSLMAAFFFLYLYMSKRKSVAPSRLRRLSLAVLDFVKKHDLDARCLIARHSAIDSWALLGVGERYRSVLARLIMWTFDEDVKCSFQGTGGHLARYLTTNTSRTKDIYEASRNALGNHWGTDYPNCQIIDDDQNSTVLEFLWALMAVWQDINDLTQEPILIPSGSENWIEQTFAILEEKFSSVFQVSSEASKPRARVLVNADFDVVLFNALRVYHFRSTILDLSLETPEEIQKSIKTILAIIQQTFASNSTELHDRLQWPLFLAGIETSDPIYRDWIFSRLTSSRVAGWLQRTLDAQNFSGHRLRMPEIRNLLYKEDGLSLQAKNDFADFLQAF